jgi:hypothetical protein
MIIVSAYPVTMITTDMPGMCGHRVSKDDIAGLMGVRKDRRTALWRAPIDTQAPRR